MPMLPTLGQPMPDAQPGSMPVTGLGTIEAQLANSRRQQMLAQALQSQGYVPNSGALGAIAQIVSAWRGNKLERRADESVAQAMQRKFEEESRLAAEKQATEDAREQAKEQRAAVAARQLKASPGWEADPTSAREYGLAKSDPAYAAFLEKDRASRGTHVTVNSGPTGPQATKFQEALGTKQADQFVTWQEDAVAASEVKQKLQALRDITALQKTGKMQEAQAMIGQYFGTQAGANMQAFNATVGPMVIDLAAKLKPLSNSDIAFVRSTVPRFGNDPRANEQIINLLGGAADRQIDLYERAATYGEKNRSLDGFRPTYTPRSDAPAQPAAAPAGAPKPGTVMDGYRFKGGNPADQANWEPVR